MNTQQLLTDRHIPIEVLIEGAKKYLQETMGLKGSTIAGLYNVWKQLIPCMKSHNIPCYTPEAGKEYLSFRHWETGVIFSENWGGRISMAIRRLEEFYWTGKMYRKEKFSPSFNSEIGKSVASFLKEKAAGNRFSTYTLEHDRYYLSLFVGYANLHGIHHLSDLDTGCITSFLDSLDRNKKSLRHHVIRGLRLYLGYLYGHGLMELNLSKLLPADAYRKIARIPSVYTKDEIMRLCNSVDRGNPPGKRNYAILMLLSRYGLRASDVCSLKLENILWNDCLIVLTQYKTKEDIELPLTREVGTALIDYIQYGRPQSTRPYVFLKGLSPFGPLNPGMINTVVNRAFRQAKVDTTARKHGPHALRHSLASLLLKEGVVLPVITGILGHRNSESTKDYLRVDVENLKLCALDVPAFTLKMEVRSMNENKFHSVMAPFFHGFIRLMRNPGYKYVAAESIIKDLDRFMLEKGVKEPAITQALCEEWMKQRLHEAGSTFQGRAAVLIEFAGYMGNTGNPCFIPRSPRIKVRGFVAHIFTEDEASRFFRSCDGLVLESLKKDSVIIMLPALFRLLYGTGIRISEALLLKDRDMHLDENCLLLRDTKSRRDRLIPIAQSLSDVCREYRYYREMLPVKTDTEYFFLSLAGRACKSTTTIYTWFRTILQEAGIPHRGRHLGPRVHDFRHTFSVHSLVKMQREGNDMYCSLPVLSTYLGHSSIASTSNYVRLCESMYPELVKKTGTEGLNVYPKLFDDCEAD